MCGFKVGSASDPAVAVGDDELLEGGSPTANFSPAVARLAPGATVAMAQAEQKLGTGVTVTDTSMDASTDTM